jgi:16S rRNA (cytidine1402-2'-O)-methyltransferase
MSKGKLILVPTPLDDLAMLDAESIKILSNAVLDPLTVIVVEEAKIARRRWLLWGLPRDSIQSFYEYNEHNQSKVTELTQMLLAGKNLYLMSDGGAPAFCDPGQELVLSCHQKKIQVTSLPFYNSIVLAIMMSGFKHEEFYFRGFLPRKDEERKLKLQEILRFSKTQVLMDTPYRMIKLIEELESIESQVSKARHYFLAKDLSTKDESYAFGSILNIKDTLKENEKAEFILVINAL